MAFLDEVEPSLDALEQKLGYAFKDRVWLQTAMTAPSYRTDHPGPDVRDNQRLEFLGDAVFGLFLRSGFSRGMRMRMRAC